VGENQRESWKYIDYTFYFIVFGKHSCSVVKWWKISDYSRRTSLHQLALLNCVCGKQSLSSMAKAGYGNSRVEKEKKMIGKVVGVFCGGFLGGVLVVLHFLES